MNILPDLKKARSRKQSTKIIKSTFKLSNELKEIGKNKTFFVKTYGCQSNLVDSENICGILKEMSYKQVSNPNDADLVILNTCAIRENAEKKVFGEIGFLKKNSKRKNFMFGICGCMAQEETVVKKIIKQIPHVSFVFGTHNLFELPFIIEEYLKTKKQIIKVYSLEGEIHENLPISRENKVKAFINITYGCDKFCSYCIVPYTRGKLRSRDKSDIINNVNNLIKEGYKEVTLLGQNVNSYGIDKNDGYKFYDLLTDVCETRIERVRFATSNPWNFDKRIADLCNKYENLMPYFHLPIQSGDEKILKRMNRQMKIKDYINLIKYIRKTIPSCSISTDIIVGFPNETKKEFANTLKLYKKIKYDNAYTFVYSKREGTPAGEIVDKLSISEKDLRLEKLNNLVRKYSKWNNKKYLNKVVEVLVEGKSKTDEHMLFGYSREWKVVNFEGNAKPGEIVKVKITSISRFNLQGKQV